MMYFILSVLVLAALLFIPVSKLIWVFSVRRLQRKTKSELTKPEIDGQLNRARFISIFLCLIFSFLFNLQIIGLPGNG
ncbi:MAG: hypothetical protein PVG50_03060 [Thiohalophilus sp.]|jgi:hypothetical protein